ncbi:MAG: hypothetical protein HEQ33_21545 [Dolichospermum sp. WA123]|jgi:predicted transcriptional regulator|nr:hypothetical protein [Dolichospermum sp. WA123]
MQKIEIELDQETFNKIEQLTQTHHCEVSDLIKAMIEQLTKPEIINNSLIGEWFNDAELVDKMVEDTLQHRNS